MAANVLKSDCGANLAGRHLIGASGGSVYVQALQLLRNECLAEISQHPGDLLRDGSVGAA
jgi:hypothetical protein